MQGAPAARLGHGPGVDEIDLGALGRAVWRKKGWIIGLTLAAAGVAFIAVNLITPRYKSEARVLIESRENIFLRPEAEKFTDRGTAVDQEAVTSQVQLVLSRDLARAVIAQLKLDDLAEFDSTLGPASPIKAILIQFGILKDPLSQSPEERVLKSYFDRLVAFPVDKSRVIAIEFESEDPELAARVANAVAEGYLVLQQAAKLTQSRTAGQWLSGEIDNLRNKVGDAESKVEQYRAKTNLFVGTNNTTLSNQQLGDFNAQLSSAHAQKAAAVAKARIIRDALASGAPIEFSDISNSELIRRLSEQRVTLQGQLAEQSSTLLDQHPRIKELRAQITDLDRQLRVEADRLARSFENDAKMTEARVSSLSTSLDQLKRLAANTNEQDVQLRALEREAKAQRDLLESYLAKYREASARDSIGATSPEARIISRALVSTTPAYPKPLATVLVAGIGMLVLSVGFILTGELLKSISSPAWPAPIASPARLASFVAPPILMRTGVANADTGATGGVPGDAIEALARELGAAGPQGCRIAIFGVRRHVGTTQVAISLARSLARQGRVALVDLAFGSPNLSAIATEPGAPGISDVVAGRASFGEIITRDRYSTAHVVMAGAAPVDGSAILSSLRLSITIEALARTYDQVVMDGGAVPDIPIEQFTQLAPRALLIAEGGNDPTTAAARAHMIAAGFTNVSVLARGPRGPESGVSKSRAAA